MRRRGPSRRGITLIELLVTVVILGVVAPGILMASGMSARVGRSAQKRAVALGLAIQQTEGFRASVRSGTIPGTVATTTVTSPRVGTFTVRRTVSVDGALATCETLVTWIDDRGNGVLTDSLQLGTSAHVESASLL